MSKNSCLLLFISYSFSYGAGKLMQNLKIESRQRLDGARSCTVCTASGEISGLCAVLQAVTISVL